MRCKKCNSGNVSQEKKRSVFMGYFLGGIGIISAFLKLLTGGDFFTAVVIIIISSLIILFYKKWTAIQYDCNNCGHSWTSTGGLDW